MKPENKIILKTTPDEFADQAAEAADGIIEVAKALDELEAVVQRTSYYWIGEAGDDYRILYGENRKEIQEMVKRLQAQPARLLQMAGLTERDRGKGEMSEPLPADVL